MDPISPLWVAAIIFPIVIFTSLCVICRRRKIPVHIMETGYYDDKPSFNPPSSFTIVKSQPDFLRSPTSYASCTSNDFLTIPRSPQPPESRRSSVGREVIAAGFPDSGDGAAAAIGASRCKDQDEDYDDHDHPNYSNDDSPRGYITVLPDEPCPATLPQPDSASSSAADNRGSLSSVTPDYVNVGAAAESAEAQEAADDNYVNVRDSGDLKETLEYVNVEDELPKPSSIISLDSDDNDIPDYENMKDG